MKMELNMQQITFEEACLIIHKDSKDDSFEAWEHYVIHTCGFTNEQEGAIYDALYPEFLRVTKEEFEILAKNHYSAKTIKKIAERFQENRNGLTSHKQMEVEIALIILEN